MRLILNWRDRNHNYRIPWGEVIPIRFNGAFLSYRKYSIMAGREANGDAIKLIKYRFELDMNFALVSIKSIVMINYDAIFRPIITILVCELHYFLP